MVYDTNEFVFNNMDIIIYLSNNRLHVLIIQLNNTHLFIKKIWMKIKIVLFPVTQTLEKLDIGYIFLLLGYF